MYACMLPLVVTTSISLISNTAMIINIYKKQGIQKALVIAMIGMSNIALSICLMVRGFTLNSGKKMPLPFECTIVSFTLATSFAQLQANIVLAPDRFFAAYSPLKYRQTTTRKLWMKPLLIGETICLITASVLGCLSVVYRKEEIVTKALMISRFTAISLLALLYYKLFKKFKSNRVIVSANNNMADPRNPTMAERARSRDEKHLLMMCIGITGTFAVLNLPISFYTAIDELGKECWTPEGKPLAFFVFLVQVNMVVDPFLYFYMQIRKSRAAPSCNSSVISSN